MTDVKATGIGARAALAVACFVGVSLVAACGGENRAAPPSPTLPAPLAARLASRSDEVARLLDQQDGCGALAAAKALRRDAIAAINARRVPPRLQEPLLAAAGDLTARIHCAAPPPPPPPAPEDDEQGKHHEHGPGKNHGEKHGGKHGGKGKHGHGGGGD